MMSSNDPGQAHPTGAGLLEQSALYREFLAEREEVLRHKWLESERAGRDIGFENAVVSWVVHHRARWRKARRQAVPSLI
jgi:hypothetical protein